MVDIARPDIARAKKLRRIVYGTGTAVVLRVDQILTLFGEILQERVPDLNW